MRRGSKGAARDAQWRALKAAGLLPGFWRRACFRLPFVQHYLIVWPDEQRDVCHSRLPNEQLATEVRVSGEIVLDPPGITVAVEEFYQD